MPAERLSAGLNALWLGVTLLVLIGALAAAPLAGAVALGGGVAVAMLAARKGRPWSPWLCYGSALLIVALPHVLLAGDHTRRRCPYCAESIREEASVCPHCRSDLRGSPSRDAGSEPTTAAGNFANWPAWVDRQKPVMPRKDGPAAH